MGRPLLEYLIERLQRVKYPVELIVATSSEHSDTPIVTLCQSLGVRTFQGDLENVLSRYGQAASEVKADIIVRITADCPLIDPKVVDHLIAQFLQHYPNVDYMSNTLKRTFPRGMDTEVFTYQALQVALERAKSAYDQEHVTPYFYTHPDQFRLMNIETSPDHSNISLVVDTPEDFVRINAILRTIYPKDPEFTYQTVLETLDSDR
jgi:spore coat polysaccharide biosynthesis protein SpsF